MHSPDAPMTRAIATGVDLARLAALPLQLLQYPLHLLAGHRSPPTVRPLLAPTLAVDLVADALVRAATQPECVGIYDTTGIVRLSL